MQTVLGGWGFFLGGAVVAVAILVLALLALAGMLLSSLAGTLA